MSLQGIWNLLGSTSPAASAQNKNTRASDGSKANAPVETRPLDTLLEFLAASFNISIFELAGVLHNAKDYESLCSNEQEHMLVRVRLQTQRPRLARGDAIRAILLALASFQSMTHPTELLPVMDPDSPATSKTVCDLAQDEDAASQVLAWLHLGHYAADAPPLPPTGLLASSPPASTPSSTSPLAISNASQHDLQQHPCCLDSIELPTTWFRQLSTTAARHGVPPSYVAALTQIAIHVGCDPRWNWRIGSGSLWRR